MAEKTHHIRLSAMSALSVVQACKRGKRSNACKLKLCSVRAVAAASLLEHEIDVCKTLRQEKAVASS